MTWILPKQLHTLASVRDTGALISDLAEQSQVCAQSLFLRSKPSLARTWSLKWKRDSWTQHLSGRILKHSHGQSFVTEWISSLEVIPANHSQPPESDLEQKTLDISGHSSQTEFALCDLGCVSLRTSRDTSASDLERLLESWKKLVTKLRGEYSQRVKLAHLTRESGSSSWPTIRASEYKDTGPIGSKSHDHMLGKGYLCAVVTQDAANWPTIQARYYRSVTGNEMSQRDNAMQNLNVAVTMHGKDVNWLTPATVQIQRADMQKRIDYRASIGRQYVPGSLEEQMQTHGQAAPVNPSTDGSREESWATPRTGATDSTRPNNKGGIPLGDQVQRESAWATPRTKDADGWMMNKARLEAGKPDDTLTGQAAQWATATVSTGAHRQKDGSMTPKLDRQVSGKLNPRWVETLMGLPVGWTMPSCKMPIVPCGEIILGQSMEQWPTPSADGDSRPGANADVQKWTKIRDEKKAEGINKQLFLTTKVMMEEERIQNSASPVTIVPTNCDFLETESCQQQQNEHSELF